MSGDRLEVAERIEAAHPGYRVWVSDEGWWYAPGSTPGRGAAPARSAALILASWPANWKRRKRRHEHPGKAA
jgi:hypothetical protein